MHIFKVPDLGDSQTAGPRSCLLNWSYHSSVNVLDQFKAVNTLHSGISTVLNFLQFLAIKLPGMFQFGIQKHPLTPQ